MSAACLPGRKMLLVAGGLPMMEMVQGRSTDFLHLPDGTTMKHALSVIYPLREQPAR